MDDLFSHITGDNDPAMDRGLGNPTKPKKKKRKAAVAETVSETMEVDTASSELKSTSQPEKTPNAEEPVTKRQKVDAVETVEVDAVEVQAEREIAVSNGLTGQEASEQGASMVLTHQVCLSQNMNRWLLKTSRFDTKLLFLLDTHTYPSSRMCPQRSQRENILSLLIRSNNSPYTPSTAMSLY
jgi:hypothetical protein